ncbi:MAG: hypothetical protein AAGC96_06880 [Pseudomonadota bacterium]
MAAVLKITDKQPGQPALDTFELHLASERLSARDLIRRRVFEEVKRINADSAADREGHDRARSFLVGFKADPVEQELNASKTSRRWAPLSPEDEYAAALEGFESNTFVMLFDDRQIEDLDDFVTVTQDSELVFLRLVPLVGG